jgi:hypothetical protein
MFWNSGQEEPIIYDGEPDAHGFFLPFSKYR